MPLGALCGEGCAEPAGPAGCLAGVRAADLGDLELVTGLDAQLGQQLVASPSVEYVLGTGEQGCGARDVAAASTTLVRKARPTAWVRRNRA
jgi:acyl-CoA reductase-like NAD-dependent aldehyde dehydrogenase